MSASDYRVALHSFFQPCFCLAGSLSAKTNCPRLTLGMMQKKGKAQELWVSYDAARESRGQVTAYDSAPGELGQVNCALSSVPLIFTDDCKVRCAPGSGSSCGI